MNILLVDDDPLWLFNLRKRMPSAAKLFECRSSESAKRLIEKHDFDLAIIDLDIEGNLDGLELTKISSQRGIYSVILTSHEEEEVINQGYQVGAKDFLTKPLSDQSLENLLKRFDTFKNQNGQFKEISKRFITHNNEMKEIIQKLGNLKQSSKAVLIQGPSGTGKTYLAQIIHELTHAKDAPLVSLNCAQFNEMTIDSELFGHKKGSFTGAHENKVGLIKMAEGGTLFLDEIHGLSPKAQLKLLTALDQGIIYPVGAHKPEKVSFKIICATSENLEDLVKRGYFRKDLYFRIKTFILNLLGLKDRPEDILPLLYNEVEKQERKIFISPEAKDILLQYDWPGNVREVKDLVENWNIFGVGIVHKEDLPSKMTLKSSLKRESLVTTIKGEDFPQEVFDLGLKAYMDQVRQEILLQTLDKFKGKQSEAARALKMSKSQISKEVSRMRENGL